MMQAIRLILSIALIAAVAWLGLQLFKTIEEPILFQQEKEVRDEQVIGKLKLIRQLQLAYKANNDTFADNFANLIDFGKNGEIRFEKIIGDPNDSTVVSRTDTVLISVKDSILDKTKFDIAKLADVPATNGKNQFSIQAGTVEKNDLEIPAFEVSTPYKVLYNGLQKKYYVEKINDDIRVGSMQDGTTSGSWGS